MADPTAGCPGCGTVDRRHAGDCDHINNPPQMAPDPPEGYGDDDQPEKAPDLHPYPWRALCRHCGEAISKKRDADLWMIRSLLGGNEECTKAPRDEWGDPGRHVPRTVLSENGPVPADVHGAVSR